MALSEHFHLIHHKNTGKPVGHHHTSYPVLVLLTLLFGLFLMAVSFRVSAGPPQTQSGTIQLSGLVLGPPPPSAPTIDTPTSNQRFLSIPVDVRGVCISANTVVVERGGVPVGSIVCGVDGRYQLRVDLLVGQNILTARQYDLLNQSSPISSPVIVFYDQPLSPVGSKKSSDKSISSTGDPQPTIETSYVNKPVFPDTPIELPLTIKSGTRPYAVNIDWGDGQNDLVSRDAPGLFSVIHTYSRSGNYVVKISLTDKKGLKAFTQTAVTVNGTVPSSGSTKNPFIEKPGNLLIAWPIYIAMFALLLGFWLGEHYDAIRHKQPQQLI